MKVLKYLVPIVVLLYTQINSYSTPVLSSNLAQVRETAVLPRATNGKECKQHPNNVQA